jgi:hypothetical protein
MCPMEHSRQKNLTRRVRTASCKPAPETKVVLSSPVQVCASCLSFLLDTSFTSARLNIRGYIGKAVKLVLKPEDYAGKEARGNKKRGRNPEEE